MNSYEDPVLSYEIDLTNQRDEMASLLRDARDYILNKAQRHDLNWRDGHAIIDRIDRLIPARSPDLATLE